MESLVGTLFHLVGADLRQHIVLNLGAPAAHAILLAQLLEHGQHLDLGEALCRLPVVGEADGAVDARAVLFGEAVAEAERLRADHGRPAVVPVRAVAAHLLLAGLVLEAVELAVGALVEAVLLRLAVAAVVGRAAGDGGGGRGEEGGEEGEELHVCCGNG